MNLQTPLAEVAHHLPAEAAAKLTTESVQRQMAVLRVIRRCMSEWEVRNVYIDPISLAVVLNSLVREILGVVAACEYVLAGHDTDPIARLEP